MTNNPMMNHFVVRLLVSLTAVCRQLENIKWLRCGQTAVTGLSSSQFQGPSPYSLPVY